MLYCCGGRETGEEERGDAVEALRSSGAAESVSREQREETPAARMFEIADLPELLPPSGQLQLSPRGSVRRGEFKVCCSRASPQRRLGQRAPKLGQIGRSKRVIIEDEDLDDLLNNNRDMPVPLSNAPS